MSFEIKDKDLAGRIGRISTRSGRVETPAFFPVVNPFKQEREMPVSKIAEIGFNQVITNSFIIKQRLGAKALSMGIHKVLNFNGVIMTDSGAYQLLIYGEGRISIDPEDIVRYQDELGSDIAVIADIPTSDSSTFREAEYSVKETLRRARLVEDIVSKSKTLWVLPIQGGIYIDLVRRSASEATQISGYSMYAIGSPVKALEKYEFWRIVEMVMAAKTVLPPDKPVHLFGGGHPIIMPLMVALGVDSFDSASYVLYAREGRYMTRHGTYRIDDLDYLPCECEVCSKYDVKELLELPRDERTRLIAIHNLHTIMKELKEIKVAIREGRLWELVEEKSRAHPALKEALGVAVKYAKWIELLDPRVKGDIHGMFLYDSVSYNRPELIRHRRFINEYINTLLSTDNVVLIPGNPKRKPFRESEYVKVVVRKYSVNAKYLIYIPFFNVVPLDIDQTYPYSQFEMPLNIGKDLLTKMLRSLKRVIAKLSRAGVNVVIVSCEDLPWSCSKVIEKLVASTGVSGVKVDYVNNCLH